MVSVVISIINFNGAENTIECLVSLSKALHPEINIKVLVIDNGSTEKFQISNFKFQIDELKIIRNEHNLGFAGGHNQGIKRALSRNADFVLILNNDTLVDKNFIHELVAAVQSDKQVGIVSPKIYFAKGYEFHKDRYTEKDKGKVIWYAGGIMDWSNVIGHHLGVDEVDNGQYDHVEQSDFASGCCMLIKTSVIRKVGMFDEKYFLYYEDSDLNERVKRAGHTIIYSPKALLWHKNAGSAGGSGSALQDYYISRNRMLFGFKYAPLRSKIALVRESLKTLHAGRPWQRRGVADFYLGRFGRGSYTI